MAPRVARPRRYSAAFQGERGAFSFSAARKLLGTRVSPHACESFKDVFEAVTNGTATHGVIPIENTLHGSVLENYDLLLNYDLRITGETSLRISHHLIAMPGQRFKDVTQAFSHPVALNQCRQFFEKHKQIAPVSFYDTAGSVKMLKEQLPERAAAVASDDAAGIYGGRILKRNIEDNRQNFTRFFLLSGQARGQQSKTGSWKTSIVFATANAPGALFKAMACFSLRDLNLTKIESRPLRSRPWEYLFYVDIIGSQADAAMSRALENLKETASFFKVLGSYRPTP
jgi:prephenate dehydratase